MKLKKKTYSIVVGIRCNVYDTEKIDRILTSLGKRYKMKENGSGYAFDTNVRDFSYEVKGTENTVLRKIKGIIRYIIRYISRYRRADIYLYDYKSSEHHTWKITPKKTTHKYHPNRQL